MSPPNNHLDLRNNPEPSGMETGIPQSEASKQKKETFFDPATDWPYVIAIGIAVLKDLSDLFQVGSIPGIGTIITLVTSLIIALMLILVGMKGKKTLAQKVIKRLARNLFILILGTLGEALMFGFNFLPIETITIVSIYISDIFERKKIIVSKTTPGLGFIAKAIGMEQEAQ